MTVVATAGHVDHGKSALVRWLTGTDPDRWAEEQRRGMTIDLGFAHTTLPDGRPLSFVDVPGHSRFLSNMLAGVGAVRACLFVVDASEGWKPQSEEHLRIVEVLGIELGVVALTKVDLTDDDGVELARWEVADHLAGSALAGAPIVPVSTVTGRGRDELLAALSDLVERVSAGASDPDVDTGRARLWVDRAFTAAGSGTVVTGTLAGTALAVGGNVVVYPGAHGARIRGLQRAGAMIDAAPPGSRVAVNLAGVDLDEVGRGCALVGDDHWAVTARWDASLTVLDSVAHDVTRRGAYVVHLGAGEHPARLQVIGADRVVPGSTGFVRLHLPLALPLAPGDRFVLRDAGRGATIGGGEVLDVAPVLPATRARPDRSIVRIVAERGWVRLADLPALVGRRPDVARSLVEQDSELEVVGGWVADTAVVDAVRADLAARVAEAGELGLDPAALGEHERVVLRAGLGDTSIEWIGGRVVLASQRASLAEHPALAELRRGGMAPDPLDVDAATRREMARRGLVVEEDGVVFHPDAVAAAAEIARKLLDAQPDGFSIAEFRDAAGVTRKHAVPLAAALDAHGLTRRRGDLRVAGPALAD